MPGVRIIESHLMVEFYRQPVSKRKRIVKKWRKNSRNWRPMKHAYFVNGAYVMHPETAEHLRKAL